jgi:hypothetical protein
MNNIACPSLDVDLHGAPCVLIRMRFEDSDNSMIGDLSYEVRPGDTWASMTYDEWVKAAEANLPVTLPEPKPARRRKPRAPA